MAFPPKPVFSFHMFYIYRFWLEQVALCYRERLLSLRLHLSQKQEALDPSHETLFLRDCQTNLACSKPGLISKF